MRPSEALRLLPATADPRSCHDSTSPLLPTQAAGAGAVASREGLIAYYNWTAIGFCLLIAGIFAVRAVGAFGAGDQQDGWVDSAFAVVLLGLMEAAIAQVAIARRRR